MRYLSPSSLPGGLPSGPIDVKSIQLMRKKLLAELELSGNGALQIKDQTFSQNDILEYFETLQNETVLDYHREVSKDPILVDFLESGILPENARFASRDLYSDDAFLQWISPYFYIAFTRYVYHCLEITDETGLATVLNNPLLLTDYDRERAWLEIGRMLQDNIAQLEYYHNQNPKARTLSVDDISVLLTGALVRMILLFPYGPFAAVRNDYALNTMQVCIFVYNNDKKNRNYVQGWLENAKLLAVSPGLEKEIAAKQQEIKNLQNKHQRNTLIRVTVGVLIVLSRFVGNNHDPFENTVVPTANKIIYDGDTVKNEQQLDSVLKHHKRKDSTIHLHG